ncbi:hypothetical protein GQO11_07995 [Acinetobacter johnsonii]|uniref:hypothetical protein n=1 Tax=Acinetobacter johnsonii TaxID=40214 RepID=UPI001320D62C|nr:hypothetical protein [Acinetobacter johnsonii]MWC18601.1 hypothetical protein [Acinetobacter johnsonii]
MDINIDPFINYYWTPILVCIFTILSLKICEYFKVSYKKSCFLFFWHTLFCVLYFYYSLAFGGDSIVYYQRAISDELININFGTSFVVILTRFFTSIGFSYLDLFLINNFIGYIGLLSFSSAIKYATDYKDKVTKTLGWVLILLPSVSFWTVALGKDSIAFMAVGLALWSSLDFKRRKFLLLFSIFSMFLVRPHMGAIMAISFVFALIFDKKTSLYVKIFLGLISVVSTALIIPIMLNYIGLGDAEELSDVDQYVDKRQNSNLSGGSSVDISSMSLPMQMFTYLFRPLPFEAHSMFALLASLDNIILLLLFLLGAKALIRKSQPSIDSSRIFLWSYFYISLIILATTTANLGIAMRQKWMFIPCVIFLLLSVIGSRNINSYENKK